MSLHYNGINFGAVNTNVHVMGPVRDPSGSDQLFTRIYLQARTILNITKLPAQITDLSPGAILARIRHYLTQPRRPMFYHVNSSPGNGSNFPAPVDGALINLPDGRDDAGGPWPDDRAINVVLTTPGSFDITWACVVHLRDCGADKPDEDSPLSLRWEDSLSWDETWQATYRRSGTLIISSRQQRNIDWFRRNRLSMPVCAGFHRSEAKYLCSRDGLRCDFNFTDVQIRYAPPYPAVNMTILQSETAPLVGGMRRGAVSVKLLGLHSANTVDLARWALLIMKARVWAANPLTARGTVLGTAVIHTNENSKVAPEVEASCSYKVQPDNVRETGALGTIWPAVRTLSNTVIAAKNTPEGRIPTGISVFPWIGHGTTGVSFTNPKGFAEWANPTGAIGGPAEGMGLAKAVSLFAALLNDPCGNQVSPTPYALEDQELIQEFRRGDPKPPHTNSTTQGGHGGEPAFTTQRLVAASSGINASAYPTTAPLLDKNGLTKYDGEYGAYDYWQCLNEYVETSGSIVLPTANPDGVNIRVDYQSQRIGLIRRWAARRIGTTPTLPPKTVQSLDDPKAEDENWVYIGGHAPILRELGIAPDGVSIIYEASGYYQFEALDPKKVGPIAEIPPTLNRELIHDRARWAALTINELILDTPTQANPGSAVPGATPSSPTTGAPLGTNTLQGPVATALGWLGATGSSFPPGVSASSGTAGTAGSVSGNITFPTFSGSSAGGLGPGFGFNDLSQPAIDPAFVPVGSSSGSQPVLGVGTLPNVPPP